MSLYLDHAASTNLYPEVVEVMDRVNRECYANPSSAHQLGVEARNVIDQARYACARYFRADLSGVVFTSGATEALHLAIVGGYLALPEAEKKKKIYVSPLVHSCVWGAVSFLEKYFNASIQTLDLDEDGYIKTEQIDDGLCAKASLVIVEHGNSEAGMVQLVPRMGKQIRNYKEDTGRQYPKFIVDTAASMVVQDISLEHQVCDALAISGEKFGGPRGAGVLVKRDDFEIEPLVAGSQEFGYRAGTESVAAIAGIAKAIKTHIKDRETFKVKTQALWQMVYAFLKDQQLEIITPNKSYLSHVITFLLPTKRGDLFVQQCDLDGLSLASGSACSSGTAKPSKVLQSLGYDEETSRRGVRISFGRETTTDDLEQALLILEKHIA